FEASHHVVKFFLDVGTGATTGATMGSRTGVVIGSGPTGGWTGAVLCEQEGCTWSFVTSGIGLTTEDVGIGGLIRGIVRI
ncbi:hypothetical protein Tco_0561279, partial [Tanacetum coccineum]